MSLCDRNNTIFADGIDPSEFEDELSNDNHSDMESELEMHQEKEANPTATESIGTRSQFTETPRSRPRNCRNQTATPQTARPTETSIALALSQVTNTLDKVVKRLDKTEGKLSTMEDSLTSSSSSGSRTRRAHKIPSAVRVSV